VYVCVWLGNKEVEESISDTSEENIDSREAVNITGAHVVTETKVTEGQLLDEHDSIKESRTSPQFNALLRNKVIFVAMLLLYCTSCSVIVGSNGCNCV